MKQLKGGVFLVLSLMILQLGATQKLCAQFQANKIDIYLDAGVGLPSGPASFTQYSEAGWGFGGGISYEIRPSVKVQLYGQYHRFKFDEDGAEATQPISGDITLVDGSPSDMYNLMLNAIYEYELPQVPTLTYISIGGGFFRAVRPDFDIQAGDETVTIEQRSQSSAGFNGAIGVRHALSEGVSIYGEAKFVTSLFVDQNIQYFPLSVGIMFGL